MTIADDDVRIVDKVIGAPYPVGQTIPLTFEYNRPENVKITVSPGLTQPDAETLTYNQDYTIVGQTITLNVSIPVGTSIAIYRITPATNEAEFPQEASFDSEKISDSIDKLTMLIQEMSEKFGRAVLLPVNSPLSVVDLTLPLPDPDKGIKWNSDGTGLANTQLDPDRQLETFQDLQEQAQGSADDASGSAQDASGYADDAERSAEESESWATGDLTERPEGSAKYWAEHAEELVSIWATGDPTICPEGSAKYWAIGSLSDRPEGSAKYWAEHAEEIAMSWAIGDQTERPEGSAKYWAQAAMAGSGVITEGYVSGDNGYVVWSNGFKVQWGSVYHTSNDQSTDTYFLKAWSTAHYSCGAIWTANANVGDKKFNYSITNRTKTYMTIRSQTESFQSQNRTIFWICAGF